MTVAAAATRTTQKRKTNTKRERKLTYCVYVNAPIAQLILELTWFFGSFLLFMR